VTVLGQNLYVVGGTGQNGQASSNGSQHAAAVPSGADP
jgi:hypothetical protein